jgi:hypothetical protein
MIVVKTATFRHDTARPANPDPWVLASAKHALSQTATTGLGDQNY